jgi:hypothetical protein
VTKASATPPTPTRPRPQSQAGIHRRLVQGIAGKAVDTAIIFGEQILLVPDFLLFWSQEQYGDWLVVFSDNFYRPVPRGIKLLVGCRRNYLPSAFVLRRRLLYSYHRQTRNTWEPCPSLPKLLVFYSADKRVSKYAIVFWSPSSS